jgi:hypothetical protein
MAARNRSVLIGRWLGLAVAGAILASSGPAAAQGVFEQIFGGLRRAVARPAPPPPPTAHALVDPLTSLARAIDPPPPMARVGRVSDADFGPARGFCVRTCDGHFFPVRAQGSMSAAESCRAFCPGSETRLYSGSNIDYAVARDGSRYANLDNAYLYRRQLVAGCTCNGRTPYGLAPIDVRDDPTLRPGDIVATRDGLVAFTGGRGKSAAFTPVESYPGFSPGTRAQLSAIRIMTPVPGAAPDTTSSIMAPAKAAQIDDGARPQLR